MYDDDVRAAAVEALNAFEPFFIGLFAPLDVLEAREQERADRAIGGARTFFRLVHRFDDYDLRIDTTECTPSEAAAAILAARAHPRGAFGRLAQRLGIGPPQKD